MKTINLRSVFLFALFIPSILFATSDAWALKNWVTDPVSGAKVGWVSETSTLESVTWSGHTVEGRASGKGNVQLAVRMPDGILLTCEGAAKFRSGLLNGPAVLNWSDGSVFSGDYSQGSKVLTGFLGVTWESSTNIARNSLIIRGNLKSVSLGSWMVDAPEETIVDCTGEFAGYACSGIKVLFYNRKFYKGLVSNIAASMEAVKGTIQQKYGPVDLTESDHNYWYFGGSRNIFVDVFTAPDGQVCVEYKNALLRPTGKSGGLNDL